MHFQSVCGSPSVFISLLYVRCGVRSFVTPAILHRYSQKSSERQYSHILKSQHGGDVRVSTHRDSKWWSVFFCLTYLHTTTSRGFNLFLTTHSINKSWYWCNQFSKPDVVSRQLPALWVLVYMFLFLPSFTKFTFILQQLEKLNV